MQDAQAALVFACFNQMRDLAVGGKRHLVHIRGIVILLCYIIYNSVVLQIGRGVACCGGGGRGDAGPAAPGVIFLDFQIETFENA